MKLAPFVFLVILPLEVAAHGGLRFVDDRGLPVESPLEVCFQVDLENRCSGVGAGGEVLAPEGFRSLRIEGPDHGPVTIRKEVVENPAAAVRVPRKAVLVIEEPPPEPLTISLYDPKDGQFRAPAFRSRSPLPAEVRIPAGEFVASLSAAGRAPDLQRLSAPPGGRVKLRYHRREGWSLVIRCQAAEDRRPLARARVRVRPVEGFGPAGAVATEAQSGDDGLILLSGIAATLAEASVQQEAFTPREIRGITATPGTFTFREADLRKGGRARIRVMMEDQPGKGLSCQVLDPEAYPAGGPREAKPLATDIADQNGICTTGELAAGTYVLRVLLPGGQTASSRDLQINAGEDLTGPGCALSSFEAPASGEMTLRCAEAPAALSLTFKKPEGEAMPHAGVILRQNGAVLPPSILGQHLATLGLPAEADGSGQLDLVGLSPGRYDLFLAGAASELTLAAGSLQGFLASVTLDPLSTTELEIVPPSP